MAVSLWRIIIDFCRFLCNFFELKLLEPMMHSIPHHPTKFNLEKFVGINGIKLGTRAEHRRKILRNWHFEYENIGASYSCNTTWWFLEVGFWELCPNVIYENYREYFEWKNIKFFLYVILSALLCSLNGLRSLRGIDNEFFKVSFDS